MPSDWQTAGSHDYPTFPAIKEAEGEDPARFLHLEISPDADYSPGSNGQLIEARIRGIESLSLLRAWRAVERQLHDGGRDRVLSDLDDREAELTSDADDPDTTDDGEGVGRVSG